jgi:DNA-binding response OmpR family regulator
MIYTLNPKASGSRPRVPRALVIEDAPDSREAFVYEFEAAGFVVSDAATGEEGLDLARSFNPDVIVLDLILPGVSGFSVARVLRALEPERNVAILAVSALASEPLRHEAIEAGCDAFFSKPIVVETLVKQALRILARRRRGNAAGGTKP